MNLWTKLNLLKGIIRWRMSWDKRDTHFQHTVPGNPKFVDEVAQITFSGPEAVKAGRNVSYVTSVGVFKLTAQSIELIGVMPGIDIQKDIIDLFPAHIHLPESSDVPVVHERILTGQGFELAFS